MFQNKDDPMVHHLVKNRPPLQGSPLFGKHFGISSLTVCVSLNKGIHYSAAKKVHYLVEGCIFWGDFTEIPGSKFKMLKKSTDWFIVY